MKLFISLLLLVLFALPAWGATWYVCNVGAGATDGSSEANCYNGLSDVVQGAGGVEPGDTLVIVGTINTSTTFTLTQTGLAGSRIRITGLLGSQPGVIDGGGVANQGLRVASQQYEYYDVDNITLRNFVRSCVAPTMATPATQGNWTLTDVRCENVTLTEFAGSGSEPAYQMDGHNMRLVRVSVDNAGDDGIRTGLTAGDIYIEDFRCERVDRKNSSGDCIQHRGNGNMTIVGGHYNHDTRNKQSILDTGSGSLVVRGTPSHPLTIDGSGISDEGIGVDKPGGSALIEGVHFKNLLNYGIFLNTTGAVVTVRSNVFSNAGQLARVYIKSNVTGNNHVITNNTDAGAPSGYFVQNLAAGITATVHNNVIDMSAGGKALAKLATNTLASDRNDFYNATAAAWRSTGTPTDHSTLASWQAATSQDANSITADPQFIGGPNPTTTDGFRLKPSSPLIGTGVVGTKYDYDNKRCGNPSNIGAFCSVYQDTRSSYSIRTDY